MSQSVFHKPIQLFRYDLNKREIFLIAGEEGTIEITIFEDRKWRYDVAEA